MSNDSYNQIRNGLTNYLFSCLASLGTLDEEDAKQVLIGILQEETDKLSKKDDEYDIYVLKPLFKLLIRILENRIQKLKQLNNTESAINNYKNIIDTFTVFINNINK